MSHELAFSLKLLLKAAFLPPGIFVVVLLSIAWVIARRSPQRRGSVVALVGSASAIYCMSISAIVVPLSKMLEDTYAPLPWANDKPVNVDPSVQAIVILGGGMRNGAREYASQNDPSWGALARLRYGAQLARAFALPILVTGGTLPGMAGSEAAAMASALERDFAVRVRWIEDQSLDTADNARLTAAMLKTANINRIYLVTHANHMPRAVALFSAQGLKVVPAPMGFVGTSGLSIEQFVPNVAVLLRFYDTLHEWIGSAWTKYGR
jgi:uncharacterized SAM-binding protein YcdF (DUF218 family)